uniref:EF-hand domain family member D1 n=5 Tax=Neognathae TaxID=8825 RepID=A0A8V0ZRX2_CHICK
ALSWPGGTTSTRARRSPAGRPSSTPTPSSRSSVAGRSRTWSACSACECRGVGRAPPPRSFTSVPAVSVRAVGGGCEGGWTPQCCPALRSLPFGRFPRAGGEDGCSRWHPAAVALWGWRVGRGEAPVCPCVRGTSAVHGCVPLVTAAACRYDSGRDGYIDLMELKLMMEKLGAPQTHLGLKNMIKEVDEDFDGKLSFREFLLIFHKAAAGELEEDSGLLTLAKLSEIDVSIEGVKGAKNFFEAKVQALSSASKFEAEIRAEQDERKREEEERKHRRAAFRELKSAFTQ